MERVRAGIVGFGRVAGGHLRTMRETGLYDVVGCAILRNPGGKRRLPRACVRPIISMNFSVGISSWF